jgi:dihydromethanopterin reductase (acceptor)
MAVQIAWGITGAGHFLKETFDVMGKVAELKKVKVTAYVSSAGIDVVKMYGFWDKLRLISPGKYLQEVFVEVEEGPSAPHAGRFNRKIYKALIVSPASGNTVAKVVHGIADTIVTNAVAQAQKGEVPVYIVPSDQHEGFAETALPYRVERSECKLCRPCLVVSACPYSAVEIIDGFPSIRSMLCQGCGLCIASCPYGAVKYGEKIRLRLRKVDVDNLEKLREMDGITVLDNPQQIEKIVEKVIGNLTL